MNTTLYQRLYARLGPHSETSEKIRLGLGYGLSKKSQEKYVQIKKEQALRMSALLKVQQLIEWSNQEYERALQVSGDQSRTDSQQFALFTELTLNWSPERVMSRHRLFQNILHVFSDELMWKKLSRSERKFLTNAFEWRKADEHGKHN